MQISWVIVLISVGGALLVDSHCVVEEKAKCYSLEIPRRLPRTQAEFHIACRQSVSTLRCMSSINHKCGFEDDPVTEYWKSLLSYVENEACNPDSNIYQTLSSKTKCMSTALDGMEEVCSEPKKLKVYEYNTLNNVLKDSDEKTASKVETCLNSLFVVACGSVEITESCGDDAGHAFMDMMINLVYRHNNCPPELMDHFPRMVNALQLMQEAEVSIKEMK